MSTYTLYQVDAFTDTLFKGNPAAVCLLNAWLPDETMQAIATENNLAETAFVVGEKGHYHLRWFTPTYEIDFCGHATLSAAYVIFNYVELLLAEITFSTKKGALIAKRADQGVALRLPALPASAVTIPDYFEQGLGVLPTAVYRADQYLVVLDSAKTLRHLQLDISAFATLDTHGLIVTAPSDDPDIDIMSRFFTPNEVRTEDAVTGSAHCTLVPYWAEKLGKTQLSARQLSQRGGQLSCRLYGDKVELVGQVVPYLIGTIALSS